MLDVEGFVPVEVSVGSLAFMPKLILKIERRITKRDMFKIMSERIRKLLKEPELI